RAECCAVDKGFVLEEVDEQPGLKRVHAREAVLTHDHDDTSSRIESSALRKCCPADVNRTDELAVGRLPDAYDAVVRQSQHELGARSERGARHGPAGRKAME